MKQALITGVSGQDGAYLAQHLLAQGYAVTGTTRAPEQRLMRLAALGIADQVTLRAAPAPDMASWQDLIATGPFDEIYNLAAQSSIPEGLKHPYETTMANAVGPLALLEAVRRDAPQTRVFLASSAQVFGTGPGVRPGAKPGSDAAVPPVAVPTAHVDGPFMPSNLYGASKLFAQQLGELYRGSYGLFVSHGILFAHESPLRGSGFLTRKVTQTLAAIRAGQAKVLEVGNIDAERDWGYAPDFVRGMYAALQADTSRGYVFASGRVATVRDFITMAGAALGFALEWRGSGLDEIGYDTNTQEPVVRINPEFYRPFNEKTPVVDIQATQDHLGWRPSVTLEDMVAEMCHADLNAAQGTGPVV